MSVSADSRSSLAHTLQKAYATGLISERTLATRLDEVLHSRIIKPEQLVGDLHLRSDEPGLKERISHTMHTVIDVLRAPRAEPRDLLALDWSAESQELVIGRSSGCDIVLSDLSVSRRHARLIRRDGRWVLQDLDSTNGSWLNGTAVGRCELRAGDELDLGAARFRVD
jgi:hypothetical protein